MSNPQAIGSIIPRVMAKLGLSQKLKETQVLSDWPQIVGEAIARHCQPVTLERGCLTVNVDSSPWLNELQRYAKGMILKKLQEKLGKKSISGIRFRVGPLAEETRNQKPDMNNRLVSGRALLVTERSEV